MTMAMTIAAFMADVFPPAIILTPDTGEQMSDFNQQLIEEYRAKDGKLGGPFEGAPLLLLHTTGAKSGQERVTPVMYLADGDRLVIFATKAGAPTNPDWYHNLLAHPQASVEVDGRTVPVKARVAEPAERNRLWSKQKEVNPGFAEYEQKTSRQIPVVILEPAG
jgi:deazaflavin-dependent oxidoreductase (nitroreductase family)